MHNLYESYLRGFLKRAEEYGFTENEIVEAFLEKKALHPATYAAINTPANTYFMNKADESGDQFGKMTAGGRQVAGVGSIFEHYGNTLNFNKIPTAPSFNVGAANTVSPAVTTPAPRPNLAPDQTLSLLVLLVNLMLKLLENYGKK